MSNTDYEKTDVRIRPILWATGMLVVSAVIVLVLMWVMFDHYRELDASRDARRSLVETAEEVPPEPRLETDPTADFEEYARRQRELLNSYGWVLRADGRVRIPIERAMELVVEREGTGTAR